MKDLTRRGLIFGAAALAAVGIFAGVDHVASSTFVKDEPPLGPDATVEIVEFDDAGKRTGKSQLHRVRKTMAEWQKVLTTPQFVVTRKAATEIPYSGELLSEHRQGIFRCADCRTALFDAKRSLSPERVGRAFGPLSRTKMCAKRTISAWACCGAK